MTKPPARHMIKTWPTYLPTGLVPIFERFFEGVTITDANGVIVYVNDAQIAIDELDPKELLGHRVADAYRVDEGVSPTMQCLRTQKPLINLACYYRTRLGKVVNSIHNIFPFFDQGRLVGTICFIRDYSIVEQTYQTVSAPHPIHGIIPTGITSSIQEPHRFKNGTRYVFEEIIGDDPDFLAALEAAQLSAASNSPVMLMGETGTGKELFAQSIHNLSPRKRQSYIAINCAAIPENLLEGILFGTSRGAFTGAVDKTGLFENAHGGTLFLDELNAMPVGLQAKLLRVVQERKIRRVGSLKEIDIDLKIISSVNKEPHHAIEEGALRPDLLYRLGVVFIRIPPLRERKGDLDQLVSHFIGKCNRSLGKQVQYINSNTMKAFGKYHWPGNVRELEHVIEGAMNLIVNEKTIGDHHLSFHVHPLKTEPSDPVPANINIRKHAPLGRNRTILTDPTDHFGHRRPLTRLNEIKRQCETEAINGALQEAQGVAARAARILGISPQLLHYKINQYQIDRSAFKER